MDVFEELIKNALSNLNDRKDGSILFEKISETVIDIHYGKKCLPSSGQSCGGDGGVDLWIQLEDERKIRIACSIERDYIGKLRKEETRRKDFDGLCFLTNRTFDEKKREPFEKRGITILDIDNITKYALDSPEIQEKLGICIEVRRIQNEFLKRNFQLANRREQIESSIPRRIRIGGKHEAFDAIEFIRNDKCQISILEGHVGQGKTYALERICYDIVFNNQDLPPAFFIDLANYQPNSRYIKAKIESIKGTLYYEIKDCIILLDGADELTSEGLMSLIGELSTFLSNSSFQRKIIISQRSDTHNLELYKGIRQNGHCVEITRIYLDPLSHSETRTLIQKQISNKKDLDKLQGLIESSNGIDSIFAVSNSFLFYNEKNRCPYGLAELMEFLAEKEEKQQSHEMGTYSIDLENHALEMTLAKKNEMQIEGTSLRFSHENIQEYLAARCLSRKPLEEIIRLTTSNGIVVPHLANMVRHLLNYLFYYCSDDDYTKGEQLKTELQKRETNISILLQIDTTGIEQEELKDLFMKGVDESRKHLDQIQKDSGLYNFYRAIVPKEVNNDWLLSELKRELHETEPRILTLTSLMAGYEHERINKTQRTTLVNEFIDRVVNGNDKLHPIIIDLFLSAIAMFDEVTSFTNRNVSTLIDMQRDSENHIWFNSLCEALTKRGRKLPPRSLSNLWKAFVGIQASQSSNSIARFASVQETGEEEKETGTNYEVHSFYPFLTSQFKLNKGSVWTIIERITKEEKGLIRQMLRDDELSKTLSDGLIAFFGAPLTPDNTNMLWKLLFKDNWAREETKLSSFVQREAPIETIMDLISMSEEKNVPSLLGTAFQTFFYTRVNEDKTAVEKLLNDERIPNETLFHLINEKLIAQYKNLLSEEDERLFSDICNKKKTDMKAFKRNEKELRNSFHLAFKGKKQFVNASKKAFGIFKNGEITRDTRWDLIHNPNTPPFIAQLIEEALFSRKGEPLDHNSFMQWWDTVGDTGKIQSVLKYIKGQKTTDEFKPKELAFIYRWVTVNIKEHPLSLETETPLEIHRLIFECLSLEQMKPRAQEFKETNGNDLLPYVRLCNNPTRGFNESVDGDVFHWYFENHEILEYILENNSSMQDDPRVLGYAAQILHNPENQPPRIRNQIRNLIIRYIGRHLNEPDIFGLYGQKTHDELEIKTTDFKSKDIKSALSFNLGKADFDQSFALELTYPAISRGKDETKAITSILEEMFHESENDMEKKTIVEYHLCFDHSNPEMFDFYARFLIENGQAFNSCIINQRNLFTTSVQNIQLLKELWSYSRDANTMKGRLIRNCVQTSFFKIGVASNSNDELEKVLESIQNLTDEYGDIELRTLKRDIHQEYIDRQSMKETTDEHSNNRSEGLRWKEESKGF